MTSWFGKKKAPDGTNIIRHEKIERQMGSMGEDAAGFIRTREAAYERMCGKPESVSHEVLPQIPHIDVYTIKRILKRPSGDETFYVLMTGGMSDLPMTLPKIAKNVARRVELIFYCAEPREEYIATLRWVAHFPHDTKSWLGPVTPCQMEIRLSPSGEAISWTCFSSSHPSSRKTRSCRRN